MPRISKHDGEQNIPYDFCFKCYPKGKKQFPESQGFEHDVFYPGYEECMGYKCELCKKRLTETNG